MICFTSRPNGSSSSSHNSVCHRTLKRSCYIVITQSWTGFYFFSIHVSCPLLVFYLDEAEEQAMSLDQFSLPPVEKNRSSPSPTSGSTKKGVQKLRKSTFLPVLAFSQSISMYQKNEHNIFFWNSNYISCCLGLHYQPVFNEERDTSLPKLADRNKVQIPLLEQHLILLVVQLIYSLWLFRAILFVSATKDFICLGFLFRYTRYLVYPLSLQYHNWKPDSHCWNLSTGQDWFLKPASLPFSFQMGQMFGDNILLIVHPQAIQNPSVRISCFVKEPPLQGRTWF